MKRRSQRRRSWNWPWLALAAVTSCKVDALAGAPVEEPQWLKLKVTEASLGLELEGDFEDRTLVDSDAPVHRGLFYVVPTLGLGLKGSVYHPNLLEYALRGEGGYGWQEYTLDVPGQGTKDGPRTLLRGQADVTVLKQKPYALNFFASKDHTVRDYDFFTTGTVDSESYGGRAGFVGGPIPFSVTLRHLNEDVTGVNQPTSLDETTLDFTGYNERRSGDRTDFSYTLDDFTRVDVGFYTDKGVYQSAFLHDLQTFGSKDKVRLGSTLTFNRLDSETLQSTDSFSVLEHLGLKHSKRLVSDYEYSFDTRTSGSVSSDSHNASAGLRHRLYDSLNSLVEVHGTRLSSSSPGSSLDTTRYGVLVDESYTKRLGASSQLALGYVFRFDHENRQSTGALLPVAGEPHTLTDGVTTLLNQPQVVVPSIRVTDAAGAILYQELLDYVVIPRGSLTEIQRVNGGQIPNGGAVRVDYTAISQPSSSYDTLGNQLHFRVDLLGNLLGLYCRLNFVNHFGGEDLILEELADKAVGVDLTTSWLRVGAEFEDYDSSLSPYTAIKLFEDVTYQPADSVSLSLDMAQSWTDYPDNQRSLDIFTFIGRGRWRATSSLSFNVEGGVRVQRGEGYDQTLGTARVGLEFRYAKLLVQAGYLYENEDYLGELRQRNYFYLRARRTF